MTSKLGAIDPAVDRMMDLDSPTYGDERERSILMAAATFGMTLGMLACLLVAVVSAVFGALVLPVVAVVLMGVPSWAMLFYARRRGVDVEELANRSTARQKAWTMVVIFGGIMVTLAAMAYTAFAGHGLVVLPTLEVAGPKATGVVPGMVRGGIIGGAAGACLGLLAMILGPRMRARRAAAAPEDADED